MREDVGRGSGRAGRRRVVRAALIAAVAMVAPTVAAPPAWAAPAAAPAAAPPTAPATPGGPADASAKAAPTDAPFVDGEVIIGFRPGTPASARASALAAVGARSSQPLSPLAGDAVLAALGDGRSVPAAVEALSRNPNVRFAEPNFLVEAAATSNDPYFTNGSLWGMYGDGSSPANTYGSQAAEAWAAGNVGSSGVYVAVIDEGIDITHPDLAANIWTNAADPVNGFDDDGNGYVDDVNGWDFVSNDNTVYDGSADDHGTHVAGTIGGVGGNGAGVAGVNWGVTLVSAKFLGTSGGTTAGAILAVDYVTALKTRQGLNIVASSNSWGGGGFSQGLLDAINRGGDAGILFVAAAGNSNNNNDSGPYYPTNYSCTTTATGAARGWDCMMSVAAIDSAGARASFSSYGATTVDLGAPGVAVTSTLPGGTYGSYSGTSMATPHVSGAVALCASMDSTLTAAALRSAVLDTTASTLSMAGTTVTGGRLDVGAMTTRCQQPTGPVAGEPTALTATTLSPFSVRLNWTDGTTGESFHEVQRGDASCNGLTTVTTTGANATSSFVAGLQPSTTYCFRVRAGNGYDTGSGPSTTPWTATVTATTQDAPPPYTCSAVAYDWLDATGSVLTLSDDSSTSVALPFSFTYYGTTYTSVNVGSNGLLGFGSAVTAYTNDRIPTTAAPNGVVAAFWDDLNPGVGGTVRTGTVGTAPNRRFVTSWLDVPIYGLAGSEIRLQAVLDEATGSITFTYDDVLTGSTTYDRGAAATVGLETTDGVFGTLVSYNRASIGDRTAVRCARSAAAAPTLTVAPPPTAYVQNPYSTTLPVLGGTAPYTWSVVSGTLPAGLALSTTAGVIAGTPSTTGSATVTVRVADADNRTAEAAVTVTVAAGVVIGTSSLPGAGQNLPYSTTITASGGTGPYTFTSTTLPAGLLLDATTGVLSGTPTTAGTTTITFTVTDSSTPALRAIRSLSLAVSAAPVVSTTTLTRTMVNQSTSRTLALTGGTSPFTWSVRVGTLPTGLTLSSAGVISGIPSQAGTWVFTVTVTDGLARSDDQELTLVVDPQFLVTTTALANAAVGRSYSATVSATGGTGTYTWTASGLPAGLAMDPTGVISGTPTTTGTSNVSVVAADTANRTSSRTLSLAVTADPVITTATLNSVLVNTAFSSTLASTGGAGTKSWAVVAGTLPTGVTLSASGVLSGTPTVTGTFPFTAEVGDGYGRTDVQDLTLIVVAPVAVSTASLPQGTTGVGYSLTLSASGGSGSYTWAATGLPSGLALDGATGVIGGTPASTGTFSVALTATDDGTPRRSASRTLSLVVAAPLAVTTASLPGATSGTAYSTTLAATGGSGTRTWSLSSGSLPTGVTLSSGGVLSGTPTQSGSFPLTVRVADAYGRSATASLTLTVATAPTLTMKVSSLTVTKVTTKSGTSARATVTVVNGSGAVLGSVAVTGQFTLNGTSATTKSGTTGTNGQVSITSVAYKNIAGQTFQFCVTNLARTGYTFDPSGPACASFTA